MHDYKLITNNVEETMDIAEKLAILLKPGDVVTLEGDLGTGKTAFAKGFAKGLGVKEPITSPTFTIIKEYDGKYPFYHMDAYRLEHSEEDIGFLEYFHGEGITLVEWAQFISDFLPSEKLNIDIHYINETTRSLLFLPEGEKYEQAVHRLITLKE